MDGSLVHCHGGCEFEPSHRTFFRFFLDFLTLLINLFIYIIHNHFQTILVAEYRLMTANNAYPNDGMQSVAFRICVSVFGNVPLCLNVKTFFPIVLEGYM